MLDHTEIRLALRQKLLEVAAVRKLNQEKRIAWQNHAFTPVFPNLWVRETLLPGNEPLVSTGLTMTVGIYSIDIFVAAGSGTADVETLAKAIVDKFPPATHIETMGMGIAIDETDRLSMREAGSLESDRQTWQMLTVQVNWRAFAASN